MTPAAVLTPLLIERSFAGGVWELTANEMIWTIGSLVGGGFVSLRGQFQNKVRTAAICLLAFGVTFGLLGVARPWSIGIMGIAGLLPIIITA